MKEYLTKNSSGNYQLVNHRFSEDDIEVPEGAEVATASGLVIYFWKPSENKTFIDNAGWSECDTKSICTLDSYLEDVDTSIIWQRHTQPEELPFVDDEPKYTDNEVKYMDENGQGRSQSINDQYAEIEQVRQSAIEATLAERQAQYGCFEDVAFVTENIMAALSKVRTNGLNDLPHPHRMALYMIASKMARIVNGDYNHKDSWHDIGGYSKLIEDLL